MSRLNGEGEAVERAIAAMCHEYRDNKWMLDEHWPLNEPHVRMMIADVMARFPPSPSVRLLDVGCFNGYISFLFSKLGYQVTGTDVYELENRQDIFARSGIEFVLSNLNYPDPFKNLAPKQFEVVIIAQVIEHILNHPLGLIRSLVEVMRPGGIIVLTTPNPYNAMGAFRILRGRSMLWGTQEFIDQPKFDGNQAISQGDIHYREYTRDELCNMLTAAGLCLERSQYLGLGVSQAQSGVKRFVKNNAITQRLMSRRLFASNHYLLARKAT